MENQNIQNQTGLSNTVAIILAACIVAASIISYAFITKSNNQSGGSSTSLLQNFDGRPVAKWEHVLGTRNKVYVIKYSDTECPFCEQFAPVFKSLASKYQNEVGFLYRHYAFHPNAPHEAEAINCAGNIGGDSAYFTYMFNLFDYKAKSGSMTMDQNNLYTMADNLKLDSKAFKTCLDSKQEENNVKNDMADGSAAGVDSTPQTFIVIQDGGVFKTVAKIIGARDEKYVSAIIDQALAATK